jgi:hypothetical protein
LVSISGSHTQLTSEYPEKLVKNRFPDPPLPTFHSAEFASPGLNTENMHSKQLAYSLLF